MIKFNSLLFLLILLSCSAAADKKEESPFLSAEVSVNEPVEEVERPLFDNGAIKVGAQNIEAYKESLVGKKVGIVANQTSLVENTHLVDTLIAMGIDVTRVFSPEHGSRGTADAGEKVNNEIDLKTGIAIVSLYGKNKKPSVSQLEDIDVMVFDIQDVGLRFYTYISTLHYVMEACSENNVELILLDRPNPNGHYVAGPVLEEGFDSFIGMHKIPVVHGMTIGEYALMLNGEGWLNNGVKCQLKVVKCEGYDHTKFYKLPVAPSPNLPNMTSIYLYPELCFFEGTVVSIGRGTDYPFQLIGHPLFNADSSSFSFTPMPNVGAKHPKLDGESCKGVDLHNMEIRALQEKNKLDLSLLFDFYENLDMGKDYFLSNNFIDLLYGSDKLRLGMLKGESFESISESWKPGLESFRLIRNKYLLY